MDKYLLLHLTLLEGIGPATIQKIIERSDGNASDLYSFSSSDWMRKCGITEKTAQTIVAGLADTKLLETELHLIEQHNINVVTITDEHYPPLLKEIYLPPIVLYYLGDMWAGKCLAVVGSRKADAYGQRIINSLVPDLVAAGYTIVSGGAIGIDTMAHEMALDCGGKTIAILGSGLLRPYPLKNKSLFKKIVEHGGIVASSFPLMMDSMPGHFPARNRIVTGLSRGCLVVQAAQKSGALISAHYAMEQGREVFAVPGCIGDELSTGCNELIQQGAKLVVSSANILQEFGDRVILPEKLVLEQKVLFSEQLVPLRDEHNDRKKTSTQIYSETQQKIVAICKHPTSLEDIVMITEMSFEQVQSELFGLRLDGAVEQDFTGMWIAN